MQEYANQNLTREQVDALPGLVLLNFGTNWCGYCQALKPALRTFLESDPDMQHVPVEDGPGRPLGRSFRVKLWPTLVLMRDGQVQHILVRPAAEDLDQLSTSKN